MDVTQVRGMLFEEAVLFLLRLSGYETIEGANGDPTLDDGHPAGLAVRGRGAMHQIDAIADYRIGQPFSHPQRLLVEAKCFTNKKSVELEVARNAVGVLKDVSEYWSTLNGIPQEHRRYHYQKAIFSATAFSAPAEKYAFAHDIYLFPMGASFFFRGILDAIYAINRATFRQRGWSRRPLSLRNLRMEVRQFLRTGESSLFENRDDISYGVEWERFGEEVRRIGGVIVALVARTFPLFLVPESREVIERLESEVDVTIRWNRRTGWRIETRGGNRLFSFEIPPVLFSLYADAGILSREQVIALKQDILSELQATIFRNGILQLLHFHPDPEWFEQLRNNARQRAGEALIRG